PQASWRATSRPGPGYPDLSRLAGRGFDRHPGGGERPSEMAERRMCQRKRLSTRIDKTRLPLPRRDGANVGDRDAGGGRLAAQCLELVRRYACQDLVVVAA